VLADGAELGAVDAALPLLIEQVGSRRVHDDDDDVGLCRALAHIDSFQPGTNLRAWLFTILRNQFRSNYRKRRREVEDGDGRYASRLQMLPDQQDQMQVKDVLAALQQLQSDQREALVLISAAGYSYDEAAAICGCAPGTVKSRVNRARTRLAQILAIDGPDGFGPDLWFLAAPAVSRGGSGRPRGRLN